MMTLKCENCGDVMRVIGSRIIGRTEQKQVLEEIVFTCMNSKCLHQVEIKKYRKEDTGNGI